MGAAGGAGEAADADAARPACARRRALVTEACWNRFHLLISQGYHTTLTIISPVELNLIARVLVFEVNVVSL